MAKLIDDVEAPKERIVNYKEIINILTRKNISTSTLMYLKDLINGRQAVDVSGYSGNSTIIIPKDNNNAGYCIKVCDKLGGLQSDQILLDFFNKYQLTSKYVEYIQDQMDFLITEEITYPWALEKFKSIEEMAIFMGTTLRNFHEIDWNKQFISDDVKKILEYNGKRIINNSLQHEKGLTFMANYQQDFDYLKMKNYIKTNIKDYIFDDVIIHGDYNPRNVYAINDSSAGFVDVTDSGFGDRHYDIYWTMWTISLYLGVQNDYKKVTQCEKIFLQSYGLDAIDEKRMNICKKLNCLYWQENNDIKYFK